MPLIDIGAKAPAFTLPDETGAKRALKDFAGSPVVLYFYPRDDTPGCTKEACAFRDMLPKFETDEAAVLGVSPDDPQSHDRFRKKFDLNFTLLADLPDAQGVPPVCDRYGVWQEKTMYGRSSMGVVRTTYLIDREGKIAQRWDRVKVDGHAEEVLAAVKELT